MTALSRLCYIAIGGFIAASTATSAFVLRPRPQKFVPSLHDGSFAGCRNAASRLGGTSKDSVSDESVKDGLDQDRFLDDMDESFSDVSRLTVGAATSTYPPWKFRGHDVFRQVALPEKTRPGAPSVLLVHGFGCSTVYWRETVRALTESGYEVHAIDLLGQGMSAKPTDDIEYSINLWAQQVDTYARENLAGKKVVLIGNSVGSLVSLTAATGDFAADPSDDRYIRDHVAGIGMFNCGIGMNTRNILKDPKWNPVQKFFLGLVFDGLETFVFGNIALLTWIMDKVVTREMLHNILKELYRVAPDPDAKIDDELVDSFYLPAKQIGSPQVLRQILTHNAGLTPIELHAKHKLFLNTLPIHLVWGDEDTVIPLKWQVGQFYSDLSDKEDNAVTMDIVHGGHILFDEVPDVSNGSMLSWLNTEVCKSVEEASN